MIQQHINLNKNRLKQLRKQSFSKTSSYNLRKRISTNTQKIRQTHPTKMNSYFLDGGELFNQFEGQIVENWAAIRVLNFLNRAKTTEDLTNVSEFAESSNSYSIGTTVAQRILAHRAQLAPFRRFTALHQLEQIEGFGTDKFNDLLNLLATRADNAFHADMYSDLLHDNWKLQFYRFDLASKEIMEQLTGSDSQLKDWVSEKIESISFSVKNNRELARLSKNIVRSSYVSSFFAQEYAAIALAFWMYRVDMDNWFSLEQVLAKTRRYFAHYERLEHRLELRMLKGFPNGDILVNNITTDDLPIIINHGEQSISIWTVGLSD